MNGQVVIPSEYVKLEGPIVFLAGPVDGAPDWQAEAIDRLAPTLHIANPRRDLSPGEELSPERIDWETGYLRRAAADGAILFWMAAETVRVPWRAYAQTARAQL